MADSKFLKIGADASGVEKTFGKVRKMIEGLQKEGMKLSTTLKGMTIEKNHGMGMFAKSIALSSTKMKEFRGTTEDTAKVMKTLWQRTLREEHSQLEKTTKQLGELNKKRKEHQDLMVKSSKIGDHKGAESNRKIIEGLETEIGGQEAVRRSQAEAVRELREQNKPGTDWARISKGLAYAQAFAGSVGSAAGAMQGAKTMEVGNMARIRSFERGLIGDSISGDITTLYMANKMKNGQSGLVRGMDQYGGDKLAKTELYSKMVESGLGVIGGGVSLFTSGGGVGGTGGGSGTTGGQDRIANLGGVTEGGTGAALNYHSLYNAGGAKAMEAGSLGEGFELDKQAANPLEMASLQFLQNTASMRVHGSKGLQGRHMGAWKQGIPYGLDMGEGMAAAMQMSGLVGAESAMGGRGGYTETELKEIDRLQINLGGPNSQSAINDKQREMAELKKQGWKKYDDDINKGYYSRNVTKGGDKSLSGQMLKMEATGMDRGASAQMLAQMSFATGGNNTSAIAKLEKVFSRAFSQGITDAGLAQDIGMATAQAAIGMGGKIGNIDAVGAMYAGGIDGNSTKFDIQQNVAGQRAFDKHMNTNPFYNAYKMSAGKGILGSGAHHTQMLGLQDASMHDLLGFSANVRLSGVGEDQSKRLGRSMANANISAHAKTARSNPMYAEMFAAWDKSGGDTISMLSGANKNDGNKKKGIKSTFERLQEQYGSFRHNYGRDVSLEEGAGEARWLSGADSAGFKDKGGYKNRTDGTAVASMQSIQKSLEILFEKEGKIKDEILKALGAAPGAVKLTDKSGTDYQMMWKFLGELEKMLRSTRESGPVKRKVVSTGSAPPG